MFLGHLCPIDEYRVYGYMTSTRLKLLAVLEDVNDIREPELKRVSETLRSAVLHRLSVFRLLGFACPNVGGVVGDELRGGAD